MRELAEILLQNNISISSTESFTVGGFASEIGSIPGISKVYKGSLVSYATSIKHEVLNISEEIINTHGVVSSEVARLMAINGSQLFKSDICLSFTGNAGPSAMEDKPVGLIYIGICYKGNTKVYEYHLSGTREQIKDQAIKQGINDLKQVLSNPTFLSNES